MKKAKSKIIEFYFVVINNVNIKSDSLKRTII